eukprot:4875077-Pyramimonas_sp.AAC.1
MCIRDRWSGDQVVRWSGGQLVWWSLWYVGQVVGWSGGQVVRWLGGQVVWWYAGLGDDQVV